MGVGSPPVVKDLNATHGGPAGVLAGGEAGVVVELVLHTGEGGLGHGINPALAGFSHGIRAYVSGALRLLGGCLGLHQ